MVVVVVVTLTVTSIKFVHTPLLIILTVVVPAGAITEYPANRAALLTPVANADVKPPTLEKRLNGPESAPADVSVMNMYMHF